MATGVRFNPAMEAAGKDEPGGRARTLSLPLLAGMLIAPPLFVWLFLRPGYRPSLRRAAFFCTAIEFAITLAGQFAR